MQISNMQDICSTIPVKVSFNRKRGHYPQAENGWLCANVIWPRRLNRRLHVSTESNNENWHDQGCRGKMKFQLTRSVYTGFLRLLLSVSLTARKLCSWYNYGIRDRFHTSVPSVFLRNKELKVILRLLFLFLTQNNQRSRGTYFGVACSEFFFLNQEISYLCLGSPQSRQTSPRTCQ